MSENYKKFQHKNCEYFPCHKGVSEDVYNCLFCYCPLYMLKDACGGNFKFTHGIKDCSDCTIPHGENSYEYIMSKMKDVIAIGSDFDAD
ncbi:cysteine-rich small domain-containing protein [Fusibacter sp. JL216-2]|uniref:cysteine-rich small domain-containing protein n=1 Tax=Fusibacter sp. JL216-2 TaxID=3071453 RepID=UPI003D3426C1